MYLVICKNCDIGPYHHGMARRQVAGGAHGLQVWRVDVNMLNKQVGAADNGWSFKEANNSSPEGTNTLRNKQVYCQLVVPTCDSQKCFYMFRLLSINFHRKQKIFKHSKATVHIRTQ